jgi:site-specific recombinase XerD
MGRWRVFDVAVWHTVLSSVASSTKKGYERIFLDFVRYFEAQGLDFTTISIDVVLSFLQRYVGLSESRIRSAVASLKFFLKIYKRVDLTTNPLLDMFAKGAQNLAPLPREKTDIWNPTTVLDWIESQPVPSDFLPCAREALILLLLATGWRVDDVWKLANRMSVTPEAAVFFFGAKRKCKIKGKFTVSQTIGRLTTNERLCPIRAVLSFREKANVFRKDSCFLFVSSTGHRASKDTLRHWVEWTLSRAGIFDSAGSCRSASTSAACARNRPIDAIMSSAGWSSETTFQRFYHRKVLPAHAPLNLLDAD